MSEVRNNKERHSYVLEVDGHTAFAAYRLEEDRIVFYHTVVPPELEGRGIGSTLAEGALEDVRGQGLKVVPLCSFVKGWIDRHPEARDLLA